LLVAAAALTVAGCVDVETVVHVKPDGSGVVEERVLIKKELASMLEGMGKSMGGQSGGGSPSALIDNKKLAKQAADMGPGVTLLGAQPLQTDKATGYVARFAFTDIRKISINSNPGDRAPSQDGAQGGTDSGPPEGEKNEPIRFSFTPGNEPVLVIRSPAQDNPEASGKGKGEDTPAKTDENPADSQMAMAMMSQMFDGLRIAIAVQPETEILETNATYRDGSRVTVMEIDFGKLLADPARFKSFAASAPKGVAEAKELLKDMPGIKVDLNPEISIRMAAK